MEQVRPEQPRRIEKETEEKDSSSLDENNAN